MVKKLFDHLIPETTPESKRVWENPDPRIQWALDILEPKPVYESLFQRSMPTLIALGFSMGAFAYGNKINKVPRNAGLVTGAIFAAIGFSGGEIIYHFLRKRQADELAMVKHYLMTHPEKFPEPEPMKMGDKRVFFAWQPNRWGE